MGQDKNLNAVFPEPALVAYKRQKNIKEAIVKAKLAFERPKRVQRGLRNVENVWLVVMCKKEK